MSDRIAVFNRGRIEQVAAPQDLYERPETAFVAGFVGTTNLLDGDRAERLLGVREAHALRPERIQLHRVTPATTGPDTVSAAGTVSEVIYLGSATHTIVDLDQGGSLIVHRQNDAVDAARAAEQRGAAVHLTWQRSHCVPVDATA